MRRTGAYHTGGSGPPPRPGLPHSPCRAGLLGAAHRRRPAAGCLLTSGGEALRGDCLRCCFPG